MHAISVSLVTLASCIRRHFFAEDERVGIKGIGISQYCSVTNRRKSVNVVNYENESLFQNLFRFLHEEDND